MTEIVQVVCFVFPNGEVYHAELTGDLNPNEVVNKWKELHPEHANDIRLSGGFVRIWMLREDYQRIPATNQSAELFA